MGDFQIHRDEARWKKSLAKHYTCDIQKCSFCTFEISCKILPQKRGFFCGAVFLLAMTAALRAKSASGPPGIGLRPQPWGPSADFALAPLGPCGERLPAGGWGPSAPNHFVSPCSFFLLSFFLLPPPSFPSFSFFLLLSSPLSRADLCQPEISETWCS